MEEVLELVRSSPPGLGLLIIALAAAGEYLLPPLPADSVLLAGALLVVAGKQPLLLVWAAAIVGGMCGMWIHHVIGTALRRPDGSLRGSRYVDRWFGADSIARFQALVRRYGPAVLLINRALPGIRGVAFLAVGAAGLPRGRSIALGSVSQAGWSLGILALGVWIGDHWEKIEAAFRVYRWTAYGIGVALVIIGVIYFSWKRRRTQPPER